MRLEMIRNTGDVNEVQTLDYEHLFINLTSSFHQKKREEGGYPSSCLATGKIIKKIIQKVFKKIKI
jgi:hypothetical protein